MSSNTPQGPAGDPEYLTSNSAPDTAKEGGSGKKFGVLGAAAVGVVAVIGLGGWASYAFLFGGGSQPAEAIPASAVGYISLDLDPSASQKIEAFKILSKFPGIEKELEIGNRDDLRRWVFDMVQDSGECKGLDYAKDIWPWIGDRVAVAAVPGSKGKIAPLVVLQVTDHEEATAGVEALASCAGDGDEFGFTFADDYVLIAETKKAAESFADDAEQASLADDTSFQERTDEAGGSGIVTMYASAEAPSHLMDLQSDLAGPMYGSSSSGQGVVLAPGPEMRRGQQLEDEMGRMSKELKELYKDFEGMAGVVRFEDGAVEVEFAGKGVPAGTPGSGEGPDSGVSTLPGSTGAALSFTLPDAWAQDYLDQMSAMMGGAAGVDDMLAQMEAVTGLSVPEDLEALLGDSVAVAVDSDIDFKALTRSEDPSKVPAGIRVHGDPDEIVPVVDKLRAKFGRPAEMVVSKSSEDAVGFGFNADYVDRLLEEGDLGDQEAFKNVVPEVEKATGVFYIDFDAGDGWADEFAGFVSDGDPKVKENVEPLDALGLSTWLDGDVQHGLFRMTTD